MKRSLLILACVFLASCGTGTEEKSDITVMSFNVRYGTARDGNNSWEFRKEATIGMINELKPDLIGMQEVLDMQNVYFEDRLPSYNRSGVARDDGQRAGEFMSIFYSNERFDLLDGGNFWLSDTPDQVSRGWDGACNRMVTWVKLEEKGTGKPFWFFNTHLDHIGKEARKEGVKLLVKKIEQIAGKGTVFVTGDFNALANDEVMQPMFAQLAAARDDAPQTDTQGTFNGFGSAPNIMVIDHIFYRNATPETFRAITDGYGVPFISDHYPILAEFKY